jgi:hypothetical protein
MQSAVQRILETPAALTRYLHGEDIFACCATYESPDTLREGQRLLQLEVPSPAHAGAQEKAS